MNDFNDLTLEQLHEKLETLAEEWNLVETAIAQRADEDKKQLAEQVTQKILEAGYATHEILPLVLGRKQNARASSRNYAVWVDPQDASRTYVRGPLPGWLKDKMRAAGIDPADKEQRDAFKIKHLKRQ